MKAKIKCSACGAEIENVVFTWGRWQAAFSIPLLLVAFGLIYLATQGLLPRDFNKDLHLRNIQKDLDGNSLTVLGAVENSGRHRWAHPVIKAEFFTSAGQFVGELSRRLDGSFAPHSTDHFSVSLTDIPKQFVSDQGKIEVKISDAFKDLF